MEVLLCGANDLGKTIAPLFNKAIRKMGFVATNYFNSYFATSNHNTWRENSILAVLNADIVVYVIDEKFGDITWDTEYLTAINSGKPLVIMCTTHLANIYHQYFIGGKIDVLDSNLKEIMALLGSLTLEERSICEYNDPDSFVETLNNKILHEISSGLKLLQLHNKKKGVYRILNNKNHAKLLEESKTTYVTEYLTEILFDELENKEIRKRLIHYFTVNRILNNAQIIKLLKDDEQGVARCAANYLSELAGDYCDKDDLARSVLKSVEKDFSDDHGIMRRAVVSVLNLNFEAAIPELINVFPIDDIGIAKRILKWAIENFQDIKHVFDNNNNNLKIQFAELIEKCENYSSGPATLKGMSKKLKELLEQP